MLTISSSQLRAARALLNLSRPELSRLSGVSEPTLHRFENGENEPASQTMNKLLIFFTGRGIEFLENQGVRFRPSNVEIFEGKERFNDFYDFLYEHLKRFGGDVCVSDYDGTLPTRFRKDPLLHNRRMKKLYDQQKITFRILTTISTFNTHGYAVYRWLPNRPPSPTCFYAFGDCLALMSFVDLNSPQVVVVHSKALAEGYRQDFNVAWSLAKLPPPQAEIEKMLRRHRGEA